MPVFTAAAAAISSIATAIGFSAATAAAIGSFVVRTLVTVGISKLISNRANKTSAGAQDAGARIQLAPATNNKLPVVYGSAFIAPTITDAKITTDQKTMYYVCSLCEKTSGTLTFGNIYYDGKLVTFGTGSNSAKVISLTTNSDPVQVDTKIDGNLYIYLFNNGSSSGINTGGLTAIQILQDSNIPANQRWTSTDVMSNTAFCIVKVIYNRDADTVNLGQLNIQLTNTLTKPGDVFLDYLQDSIYGCAIPASQIDTTSFTALNTYSDQTITYVPVGGGSTTQPRYRINGPINTGDNCLSNLQQLADSCDSWLQYSELTGKWKVVINKPYTGNLTDLYHVDSSVLIGGIDINPLDLNQTFNSLEVQYPDANIKDQTNYKVVDMTDPTTAWYDPTLLSPNEPDNRIVVQLPQVNNYVQAVYLGVRRLLQSREDLTINFNLDYSGIQIEAGDVVRVTLAEYGWTNKLFRVSQVQETKTPEGFLGARITAFEYNGTIYGDNAIQDYIPEDNTGLPNPSIIGTPNAPSVSLNVANSIAQMTVTGVVPTTGQVLYMDFNAGTTGDSADHQFIARASQSNGAPYAGGTVVSINSTNLPTQTYYWSVTARNDLAGARSVSSNSVVWPGPTVTTANNTHICNANSSGNLVTLDTTSNISIGSNVAIASGNGTLAANSYVANINSANTFTLSAVPTVALSNACLNIFSGGIGGNNIQPNSITNTNIVPGAILPISLGPSGVTPGSYTRTNLTVNAQGLITAAANGTGGGGPQLLGTAYFVTVPDQSNVNPILNLATQAYNHVGPVYLNGTTVNSSYYYPLYQGTSSTANGYYANSTSAFNPAQAAYWSGNQGDLGYYAFIYTTFNWNYGTAAFNNQLSLQIVATANTSVQFNSFSTFQGYGSTLYFNDQSKSTHELIANKPTEINISTYNAGDFANTTGAGWLIRNMVSGTSVYLVAGWLNLYAI